MLVPPGRQVPRVEEFGGLEPHPRGERVEEPGGVAKHHAAKDTGERRNPQRGFAIEKMNTPRPAAVLN